MVPFIWIRCAMARLTPRAARCLKHAEDIAQELGQGRIGTEHLTLGLLREPDGIAAQVLENLGVAQQLGEEIVHIINSESYRTPSNRVVNLKHAEDIAQELGQSHIGTEHLILGLLREPDGIAAQVLENLGVTQQLGEEIVHIINSESYRTPSNRVVNKSGEHFGWMVRTGDGSVRVVDDDGRHLTGPLTRRPPPHIEFETE